MPVKSGHGVLLNAETMEPISVEVGEFSGVYDACDEMQYAYEQMDNAVTATIELFNGFDIWQCVFTNDDKYRHVVHLCKYGKYRTRKKNRKRVAPILWEEYL